MNNEVLFLIFLCIVSGAHAGKGKKKFQLKNTPSTATVVNETDSSASEESLALIVSTSSIASSSASRRSKTERFTSVTPKGDIPIGNSEFLFKCDDDNFIVVNDAAIEVYNVAKNCHYPLLQAESTITAADFDSVKNLLMYGTESGAVTISEVQKKNYKSDQVLSFVTRTINACAAQKTQMRIPEQKQRTYYALQKIIERKNSSRVSKCLISIDKTYAGVSFEAHEHDAKTLTNQTAHCFHQSKSGEWRDYSLFASVFPCNNTHHAMTFIRQEEDHFLCLACNTMLHKYPLAKLDLVQNYSLKTLSMGEDETITDISTIPSSHIEDKNTLALLSLQYLYLYSPDSMELLKKIVFSAPRPSRKLSIMLPHISTGNELFSIEDIFTEAVKIRKKAAANEKIVCLSNGLMYLTYEQDRTAISELSERIDSTLSTSPNPLNLSQYADSEDDDDE